MRKLIVVGVCALVVACSVPNKPSVKVDPVMVKNELYSIMAEQESAWNEGDIESFMHGYLPSDSVWFTGGKGILYGYNNVLANYKRSYPGKEGMGRLLFDNSNFQLLADSVAAVAGQFTLFRSQDTLSGRYTLLWKQVNGEWKIVADHSS